MKTNKTKNKAVKHPSSNKASVVIVEDDDVIVITDEEIQAEIDNDNVAPYLADGKAWLRYPEKKYDHLRKNLTREQRLALKRRGLKVE